MLRTLTNELLSAGHGDITIGRDRRFMFEEDNVKRFFLDELSEKTLKPVLQAADYGWLIAPETAAKLFSLSKLFEKFARNYIGCSSESIRLTTSKSATYRALLKTDIVPVETAMIDGDIPLSDHGWVVKPDDGAGAEECRIIYDRDELLDFKNRQSRQNYIIQPYLQGESVSMSLLVYNKDFRILACNRQYISDADRQLKLFRIGINECLHLYDVLFHIAGQIVDAIPGLAAYVGVDLIKTDTDLLLLEINPRFTTSCVGLSPSLGLNVTDLILNTFINEKLPALNIADARPIQIQPVMTP